MIATLTTEKGEIEVNIPFSLAEILWFDWCDFRDFEQRFLEYSRTDEELTDAQVRDQVVELTLGLAGLLGDWVKDLRYSLPGFNIPKMIDQGYYLAFNTEVTIVGLYAHLLTLFKVYKPDEETTKKTFFIEVDGQQYGTNWQQAAKYLTMDASGTGEMIEVLEYQRIARNAKEQKKFSFGTLDYNFGLEQLAVMMRKKGEELPWNRSELDKFVSERKALFSKHVTCEDVHKLRFFLINSFIAWSKTKGTGSFGTPTNSGQPGIIRKLTNRKSKKRRKRLN